MGMTKKEASANYMREHQDILSCPLCQKEMKVTEESTVICENRHTFDLAKQGYVNFMTHPAPSMYGSELFNARKKVIDRNLYHLMYETIVEQLNLYEKDLTVLDTGCGEGSHLVKIKEAYEQSGTYKMHAAGIDIAKEGIVAAAKNYGGMMWYVGDLAKSPFKDQSFDCILNILSPANYSEFQRLLKPDGVVVKVVPQSGYLKELRDQFFVDEDKKTYSNAKTVERFKEQFKEVTVARITATLPLEKELVPDLVHMTPLGWHQKEDINEKSLSKVTIDLDVCIGKF